MTKGTVVFLSGLLLVVLPFLGIPAPWKLYATVSLGGLLALCGYLIRRQQYLAEIRKYSEEDTFMETTGDLFTAKEG